MSTVHPTIFDRDSWAQWYARQHLQTDPGITAVYYLPTGAGVRDIRLVEVNTMIGERLDDRLEPIDFGIDFGEVTEHRLVVLDVSSNQWGRILNNEIPLPSGWSLDKRLGFSPSSAPPEVDDSDE